MALTKYFESINSDGHIIINDSFKNMSLIEEFNITATKSYDMSMSSRITYKDYPDRTFIIWGKQLYFSDLADFVIKVSDQFKILSFYSPNSNIGIFAHRVENTYVMKAIPLKTMSGTDFQNAIKQIVFRIYGYDSTASTKKVGLQIFNASGNLLFDSNKKYLHVADFKNTYVSKISQLHLCTVDEMVNSGGVATYTYKYSTPIECACFSSINFLMEAGVMSSIFFYSFISFPSSTSIDVRIVPYSILRDYVTGFVKMMLSMLILQR